MIDLDDELVIAFLEGAGWRRVPSDSAVVNKEDLKALIFGGDEDIKEALRKME
jgi:hypothetical protein